MSGNFDAIFPATDVSASIDLCELNIHAARPAIVLGIYLYNLTDIGDAQEQQLQFLWKTGATTTGSDGNAAANGLHVDGGGASGFTYETFNTTKASGGTIVTRRTFGWNIRAPYERILTQEELIIMPAGSRWTLELVGQGASSAPLNAPVKICGGLLVQEIGT